VKSTASVLSHQQAMSEKRMSKDMKEEYLGNVLKMAGNIFW
jgi:hypothetical protein